MNLRIESPRLFVHGDRCVEQATVATGVYQAGKEFRIGTSPFRALDQSARRILWASQIDLDVRIQVVGKREVWVNLQSALACVLSQREIRVTFVLEVPSYHAIHPSQTGPSRSVTRIFLDTTQVEISGKLPLC